MAVGRALPDGMYEVHCDSCGRIGVHPSRVGAESMAEVHSRTEHDCAVEAVASPPEE